MVRFRHKIMVMVRIRGKVRPVMVEIRVIARNSVKVRWLGLGTRSYG